MISKIHKKRFE